MAQMLFVPLVEESMAQMLFVPLVVVGWWLPLVAGHVEVAVVVVLTHQQSLVSEAHLVVAVVAHHVQCGHSIHS